MPLPNPSSRRFDLDWLRVIAFGLLIFYHIGMFYVTWGWHVKSVHASAAPELLMMFINPWRLSLLFFISGIALRYAFGKTSGPRLSWSRLGRLGVPLVFGVHVVIAPQSYFQLLEIGEIEPGFWQFYMAYLSFDQPFSITTPTWNHLWYLVYLLVYTLLVVGLAPIFRRLMQWRPLNSARGGLLLVLVTPLIFVFYRFALTPYFETTHDLVNDWANHANSLTIFIFGFLIAKHDVFWSSVDRVFVPFLIAIVVSVPIFASFWPVDRWMTINDDFIIANSLRVGRVFYAWAMIIVLCGLARKFLGKDGPVLRYLTSAVFCYYILHQTIIVVAGFYLTRLGLPVGIEFSLVAATTIIGCVAGYELLKHVPYLRYCFGIKQKI